FGRLNALRSLVVDSTLTPVAQNLRKTFYLLASPMSMSRAAEKACAELRPGWRHEERSAIEESESWNGLIAGVCLVNYGATHSFRYRRHTDAHPKWLLAV